MNKLINTEYIAKMMDGEIVSKMKSKSKSEYTKTE